MPILQINFKVNMPADEYASICRAVAQMIADVPGLRWKIWISDERRKEAGGIYLFDSEQALNNYLSGPIVGQLRSHPAFTDISVKRFDVMKEFTGVTRGPAASLAASQP